MPEFIDPVLEVKMIVFAKTSPKHSFSIQSVPIDASLSLFWMRSYMGVVFKYRDFVEHEISWFSCSEQNKKWRICRKQFYFAFFT
jgi:hypothetical protein